MVTESVTAPKLHSDVG